MFNLTQRAKNHFLNFFRVRSKRRSKDFLKAEYKKDWKVAYAWFKRKILFRTSFAEHYNWTVVKTGKTVFPGHWHVGRETRTVGQLITPGLMTHV